MRNSAVRVSRSTAAAVGILLTVTSPTYAGGNDPLGGIIQWVMGNAEAWCGAILVIGLIGVALSYALRASGAGEYARSMAVASIFLVLASMGVGALAMLKNLLNI